jgi:hypothetical protein
MTDYLMELCNHFSVKGSLRQVYDVTVANWLTGFIREWLMFEMSLPQNAISNLTILYSKINSKNPREVDRPRWVRIKHISSEELYYYQKLP